MTKSIHDQMLEDRARQDKALNDRIRSQAGKRQKERETFDAKLIRSDGVKGQAIFEKYAAEDEEASEGPWVFEEPETPNGLDTRLEDFDTRMRAALARRAKEKTRVEELAWAAEALQRLEALEAAEEAQRIADETLDDPDAEGLDSLDARFKAAGLRKVAQQKAASLTAEERLRALTEADDKTEASEYETEEWIASIRRIGAAGGEIAERFFAKYPEERKWLI